MHVLLAGADPRSAWFALLQTHPSIARPAVFLTFAPALAQRPPHKPCSAARPLHHPKRCCPIIPTASHAQRLHAGDTARRQAPVHSVASGMVRIRLTLLFPTREPSSARPPPKLSTLAPCLCLTLPRSPMFISHRPHHHGRCTLRSGPAYQRLDGSARDAVNCTLCHHKVTFRSGLRNLASRSQDLA